MLLLGQREIKQHTLVMNWHNARIILLCIIVYHLRRFEISLYSFQSIFILLGLSRGLGRRKSCLGRYLFRPSSWGEISTHFFFFALYINTIFFFLVFVHFRWTQPRPVYWSPSLTSTCRIYKKSMISWSSKSMNLVLIIDVLVSDHQTIKKKQPFLLYIYTWYWFI